MTQLDYSKFKFPPSKYQDKVFQAAVNTDKNLVVNAKAGSGKTTTIEMLVSMLPISMKILVIAFNKSIVKELQERLPSTVEVRTSHSLGMKILLSKNRVKVENNKIRAIINVLLKMWDLDEDVDVREYVKSVSKLVNLCRLNLIKTHNGILTIAEKHGIEVEPTTPAHVVQVMKWASKDRETIDFVDMIYFPCVYNDMTFPKYDLVLVDECQDLNTCQQKIMKKVLKKNGRFIAVGDIKQAIYGFAGADTESFQTLLNLPNTIQLPLNECYRCGKEIIKYVNDTVEPQIEAFKGNVQGKVDHKATVNNIEDGDMVLCRNTMPLVKLCYKFLAEEKAAYIKGKDVGATLENLIKRSKRKTLETLIKWLDHQLALNYRRLCRTYPQLEPEEIKEKNTYVLMNEKHEIIKLIINNNGTVKCVNSLMEKIHNIFKETQHGGICLSTVHKSKGLEADNVYILDHHLMPSKYAKEEWQKEQERNIRYVAYTRAKNYLGFIDDWSAYEENVNYAKEDKEELYAMNLADALRNN